MSKRRTRKVHVDKYADKPRRPKPTGAKLPPVTREVTTPSEVIKRDRAALQNEVLHGWSAADFDDPASPPPRTGGVA